jgi:short-chain fatty acids transporter
VVGVLALLLLAGFIRYVWVNGAMNIQINEINALMFALGLILHGSPRAYMLAVEDGARDCGAIIVQFPIYAGIMSLMKVSGMIETLTDAFIRLGDARTLPAMSFVSATLVGLFVPSGGAQWGLQGPIALQASANAGLDPGAMLMSVAYGDELANMLQPFWALPLLAITGAKAREIVGYTAIAMIVAGAWMMIGLLIL